jgi:hypothetical protein
MKIFVIREVVCGNGIQEYQAEGCTEFPARPNCVKVKHASGGVSFFDLGLDAFETYEEAQRNALKKLSLYIEDLEKKLRNIEADLQSAKESYSSLVGL